MAHEQALARTPERHPDYLPGSGFRTSWWIVTPGGVLDKPGRSWRVGATNPPEPGSAFTAEPETEHEVRRRIDRAERLIRG